jgi:hypothetical protein
MVSRHARRGGLAALAAAAVAAAVWPATPAVAASGPGAAAQAAPSRPDPRSAATSAARSSGKPVVIDAFTDAFDQTAANPDGSYTWTSSVTPVRVKRGAGWVPVDATLAKNADGSVSPKAVENTLTLSGGGAGPLATMTVDGKRVSFSFPLALPAPTLSGDTATYADVLPGVDLQAAATAAGGFSEVFVVHDAAGAANPQLKSLRLTASGAGLSIAADAGGNLSAKDSNGAALFTAPAPAMWDSAAPANPPAGRTLAASRRGPAYGGRVTHLPATAAGNVISLLPDQAVLNSTSTVWPVYIDPTIAPAGGKQHYDEVQQGCPSQSNLDSTSYGDPGVGYNGYSGCVGIERSYFQIAMPANIPSNATILSGTGTLNTQLYYAAANGSHTDTVSVAVTGGIGSGTTWNNQPCRWDINAGACSSGTSGSTTVTTTTNYPSNIDPVFNITGALQAAVAHSYSNLTLGLFNSSESDSASFIRFYPTPTLSATYDVPPSISAMSYSPNVPVDQGTNGSCPAAGHADGGWLGKNSGSSIALGATVQSASTGYGAGLGANFWVHDDTANAWVANGSTVYNKYPVGGTQANGQTEQLSVPIASLPEGDAISWWTDAYDHYIEAPLSGQPTCHFSTDFTSPGQPAVSSDQFPSTGTGLKAHSLGTFNFTATDPGAHASGIWCFEYAFDSDLTVPAAGNTCQTAQSVPAVNGAASIAWAPPAWGTHMLQVAAVDKAGNTSAAVPYTFFAPDDPNAQPAPGNLTGDGQPDYLTTDAAGDLVVYRGYLGGGVAGQIAATPAESPDGQSWATWQVTHRGSMHGLYVDDLLAHKTGSTTLYIYYNDGAGHFTRAQSITSLSIATGSGATDQCTCSFANATQIVALGDGDAGTRGADYPLTTTLAPARNVADLIAVVPDANGVGQEWLFTYKTTNAFNSGQQISAFTTANNALQNLSLYSPGDAGGDGLPDLWGTNTATGQVVQFASATNADGSIDWGGIGGAHGSTNVATVSGSAYQLATVSSPGTLDADGHVNLWGIDAAGQHVVMWSDPAANGTAAPSVQATVSSGIASSTGPRLSWTLGNGGLPGQSGSNPSASDVVTSPGNPGQIVTEYDSSGNGRNGAANGNVTAVNGHDGAAAQFDGAAGEEIATSAPAVDTGKSFSVSAWAKLADTSTYYPVAAQNGTVSYGFWLGYDHNLNAWALTTIQADANATTWYSAAGVAGSATAGVWTHLVGVYDASSGQLELYVNGVLQPRHDAWPTPFTASGTFSIGNYLGNGTIGTGFKGGIDDVSVYGRALGSSEVTSLYDAGKVQPLAPTLPTVLNGSARTVCAATAVAAGTTGTLTPTLGATAADTDATVSAHADFEVWDATDPTQAQPVVLGGTGSTTANGTAPAVSITTPTLTNGHTYGWSVRTSTDDGALQSPFSPPCYFTAATAGTTPAAATGALMLPGDDTVINASTNTAWVGPETTLKFLSTGNLVVYRNSDGATLWTSGTASHPAATLVMQKDGNLVIYDGRPAISKDAVSGTALWSSHTSAYGGARLVIGADGDVALYGAGTTTKIWDTGTTQPA